MSSIVEVINQNIEYIGREGVLGYIETLTQQLNIRHVLCIDGKGGIGKTRLLTEVFRNYCISGPNAALVLEPIDFDDLAYHNLEHVQDRIAQLINEDIFEAYWLKKEDLQRIRRASISSDALQDFEDQVQIAFRDAFNRISTQHRIILLLDTVERVRIAGVWEQVCNLIASLSNILVLIAGRQADQVWQVFEKKLGADVEVITLEPLTEADSERYLEHKQRRLHVNLDPSLVKLLVKLSRGSPILLDLVVEWTARNIPVDWLREALALEPGEANLADHQDEFERLLVRRIAHIRTPMDRLSLLLSRVYPLDVGGIVELLRIPDKGEAEKIFDDARTYVFVKIMTGERISLHDEMRRMINDHVWPVVDPNQTQRIHESRLASAYLKRKMDELDRKITQSSQIPDDDKSPGTFAEFQALEREYWVLRGQYLEHTLYSDLDVGVKEFIRLFEDETSNNAREVLFEAMSPYIDQLDFSPHVDVLSRQITLLRNTGLLQEALDLAQQIGGDIEVDQRVRILTSQAEAQMRLGKPDEAVKLLEVAQQTCELHSLTQQLGIVLNNLGRAYRSMGRMSKALDYYESALNLPLDQTQVASILNNLGYILSLEGRYQSALNYCIEALNIRKDLGKKLETGASLSTIGEVYRNWGKYHEALNYYNQALSVFEPEKDPLWLARLYSYRGAVYRLLADFDQAKNDLEHSIEMDVPAEKPWAYHVLGCVYWNREDLESALNNFNTSDHLAIEIHDTRTHVNNLVSFAEIFFAQWIASEGVEDRLLQQIKKLANELVTLLSQGYDFPHHLGRMQRVMGDIAFEQKQYNDALEIYAQAYAALGQREGGYGRRTFIDELDSLKLHINKLSNESPQEAIHWCAYFKDFWSDEQRDIKRRDELISMLNIRRINIESHLRQQGDAHG